MLKVSPTLSSSTSAVSRTSTQVCFESTASAIPPRSHYWFAYSCRICVPSVFFPPFASSFLSAGLAACLPFHHSGVRIKSITYSACVFNYGRLTFRFQSALARCFCLCDGGSIKSSLAKRVDLLLVACALSTPSRDRDQFPPQTIG